MERIVKAWPCLATALLLVLASPPVGLGLLVFVALVPWLISISKTTRGGAWKSGYLLGFLLGVGQLYWIGALTYQWTKSPLLGILPWVLASAAYALYFGWAGVLIWKCYAKGWLWMIPLVWTGIEITRSYMPVFAFPWGIIASPLWPATPIIQSAYFGMIFLVSAWVVLVNLIVSRLMSGEKLYQLRPYVTAFSIVLILSLIRYVMPDRGREITVAAIQPGVDMAFGDQEREWENLQNVIEPALQSATVAGADLAVLPEGIADGRIIPPLTPFRQPPKLPLIVGGRRGMGPVFQSAFAFDGQTWQYADKTRLVIFGEFVPGREQFPFLAEAFRLPSGDMVPGREGVKHLRFGDMTVGPIVCFEAMFTDIAYRQTLNGAELLTVISIDDWYMGTNAPAELASASIWRAVESGLPLVRSASLGKSMVVDSKGRILAEAPLREPRLLMQEVTIPKRKFVGFSAAFPVFALVVTLAFGLVPLRRESTESDSGDRSPADPPESS